MGDGLWNRQQQQQQQHQLGPSGGVHKRPRSDYGQEMHGYFAREDDIGGPRTVKDSRSIGSAYDRYLQNAEMPSYTSGEASTFGGAGMGRAVGGGMSGPPMADHSMRGRPGAMSSDLLTNGRNMNLANQLPVDATARPGRETVPLPLDASSTLYVEGLPPDSTRREVARILYDLSIMLKSWCILLFPILLLNSINFPSLILYITPRYLSSFCGIQSSEACEQRVQTSWWGPSYSLFCGF
ncbi:unnamed protein product [Malus baccata var. baccata]